jgi:hypothetical protein
MLLPRRSFLHLAATPLAAQTPAAPAADLRHILNGRTIPDEGYCDQPYVVILPDRTWLCLMTTGRGVEGEPGQHIVSIRSRDQGNTWTPFVDIEPAAGPEASWVMPLLTPSGRVYALYTYNKDNLRSVRSNNEKVGRRVDTMGAYMFKYSDDGGHSWSKERYEIPLRNMRIDRENDYGGSVRFFWGVGKPITLRDGAAIFGFAKVGRWGNPGTMIESQGCFLRSDNILTERDPAKIRWQLLPEGDEGLRAPKGPVSDEANPAELSDGSLYATYRTIDGYLCHAYSRDGGRTWTPPAYAIHSPADPRPLKHPRAANFVRKFSNGKFLLWFHNHGGEALVSQENWAYYTGRNPGWICGGIERDGHIHWSEPEILLYDDDPAVRISYPDFIEDGGRFFITETQKTVARVHEIPKRLLDAVWSQHETRQRAGGGIRIEHGAALPALPDLSSRGGFSLDFWVRFRELTPGQKLIDAPGLRLETSNRFSLRLTISDGARTAIVESDAGTHPGTLGVNRWHHVVCTVDGGPKIVSFVVDGKFNDGGAVRDAGWTRFDPALGRPAIGSVSLASGFNGQLGPVFLFPRALLTSEAVGNWRAGRA